MNLNKPSLSPLILNNKNNNTFDFSFHSQYRLNQRNIKKSDIQFALKNAKKIYKGNACFFFIRRKDLIKVQDQKQRDRLNGLVVVMSKDNVIITVYKNTNALSMIKRKR